MSRDPFLEGLQSAIGTAVELKPETRLADVPEWDSLTIMSTVTYLAVECQVNVTFTDMREAVLVSDIMKKAGVE